MKKQVANTVYLAQNLAVPVLVFIFVRQDLALLAFLTVLLSKWRVVAISPRFWLANIRSNSCDIIVGLSTVALMSYAPISATEFVNPLLALLYGVWLVFVKPKSGRSIVTVQAFICQFYGLSALYLLVDTAFDSFTWLVILFAWLVGRASVRHFLSSYEDVENKPVLITLWAFLIAQLAWVFWVWNVIYVLPSSVFAVPLIAIISSVVTYAAGAIYHVNYESKLQKRFVIQQALFVAAVLILVISFTRWTGQV